MVSTIIKLTIYAPAGVRCYLLLIDHPGEDVLYKYNILYSIIVPSLPPLSSLVINRRVYHSSLKGNIAEQTVLAVVALIP